MPCVLLIIAGDVGMDVDEEDGWTVVKKGGKRR